MPELKCTVDSCYYNKRECCCKGTIEVTGSKAKSTEETNCESFVERKRDSISNATEHPCRTIDVVCQATSCQYNDNNMCDAKDIGISGTGAHNCSQTECASFRCCC